VPREEPAPAIPAELVEQQCSAKRGEWVEPNAPTLRRALRADEVVSHASALSRRGS
jgi:hypothetical protein